jgi:hypothetical protein
MENEKPNPHRDMNTIGYILIIISIFIVFIIWMMSR